MSADRTEKPLRQNLGRSPSPHSDSSSGNEAMGELGSPTMIGTNVTWDWDVLLSGSKDGEFGSLPAHADVNGNTPGQFLWSSDWHNPAEDYVGPPGAPSIAHTRSSSKSVSRTLLPQLSDSSGTLNIAQGAATAASCECLQQVTSSVFKINNVLASLGRPPRAGASKGGYLTLGKLLTIYGDRVAAIEQQIASCSTCLRQPDTAQLLIVNLEQLAQLHEYQHTRLTEDNMLISGEQISIGSCDIDGPERLMIIKQLLVGRKMRFTKLVISIHEKLTAASLKNCYKRLQILLEQLDGSREW